MKNCVRHATITSIHYYDLRLRSKGKKQSGFTSKKNSFLGLLAILIITIIAFINVKDHQFVNWDDDKNFYKNDLITSLNDNNFWQNTKDIFTTHVIGNYNPLSTWTFAIEHKVFGLDDPGVWHLNNLLLHLIAIFLVYKICIALKANPRMTFFVTLLFARSVCFHPVCLAIKRLMYNCCV